MHRSRAVGRAARAVLPGIGLEEQNTNFIQSYELWNLVRVHRIIDRRHHGPYKLLVSASVFCDYPYFRDRWGHPGRQTGLKTHPWQRPR